MATLDTATRHAAWTRTCERCDRPIIIGLVVVTEQTCEGDSTDTYYHDDCLEDAGEELRRTANISHYVPA